ncbi:hypothetical protein B0H14DRAFT_2385057, partial [Mycena olivaceomarginata]
SGHFALVLPLLPLLRHTGPLRCTRPRRHPLERGAPRRVEPDFSDLKELNQACSTAMDRYGNSTLSNILFTNELQRRLAGTSICRSRARRDHDQHLPRIETDSPATGTHASYPWLVPFSFLEKYVFLSPEQGARTQLSAATAPEVEERDWRAAYLAQRTPNSRAQDEDGQLATQFEALYEKLVAEAYSKVASS